jgi:hypothetical protein
MTSTPSPRNRRPLFFVGMTALLAANLSRWFLSSHSVSWQGAADAAVGGLFGVAIGALLLHVWRSRAGCTPARS